jgi:hypothetical protein
VCFGVCWPKSHEQSGKSALLILQR